MPVEYRGLVLDLLSKHKYPILQDFVIMDIHYKLIPEDAFSDTSHAFDQRIYNPLHEWIEHTSPYQLSYLVANQNLFYVHKLNQLQTNTLPFDCQRIKLSRLYVDALRNSTSASFEEELYHFITLLNFNPPLLAPLLGLDIMTCTRFMPQFIRMWVYQYDTVKVSPIPINASLRASFGPPERSSVLPIRVLRGKLAPCTSRSILLSLNNDLQANLPQKPLPYLMHYSDRLKSLIPLAYNPLENPIIVHS
ncbi:hypothetical protein AVEN_257680-1 [Araneus ventricosus]|uniref:Uncharacterized protein n=1 Tax=Araneus ventricosus TaxID=182803 RepID=A0A4Y2LID7_ARAVE|nr:hypothetical protein AVEN_257680-1 [Araneus ventricosus]